MERTLPLPFTLFLTLLSLGTSMRTEAQLTLGSVQFNEHLAGPSTCFEATVLNAGAPTMAKASGELRTSAGEIVLQFHTSQFQLPSGSTIIRASSIPMNSFVYGNGSSGSLVSRTNRLPSGAFIFCLALEGTGDMGQMERLCEELVADDLLYMDALWPLNGDTIEEVRPALSWTLLGGEMPPGQAARLVLVPDPARDAARSITRERPLFQVEGARMPAMPYPGGVAALEPGKCYAWQVERATGDVVVDRTEPWRFCVRKEAVPPQNKYVDIVRVAPGSVYRAVSDRIYFRYDEAYNDHALDCTIYDASMKPVKPDVAVDGTAVMGAKHAGTNLYELDLAPYRLKTGQYDLVVRDAKQRSYVLKFQVAR